MEPKSKCLKSQLNDQINTIVRGQGVFIFSATNNISIDFTLYNKDKTDGIKVNITQDQVLVNRIGILAPYTDTNNKQGLSILKGAYYWFSFDSQNQMLHVGIGETRIETVIYRHQFKFDFERDDLRKDHKLFLESLITIHTNNSIKPIRLLRDPITTAIPLLVRNSSDLTMFDIAMNRYMMKSNLSLTAQKLYDCIAGPNFILDTDDFPDFSKAIEYSIVNPDGWCYKKLKAKANEFNKEQPNLDETYLRITLGQNNGESPGIPYVMEIWPVGHYSPIHNHAGAEAIIRVLHGSINVSLYPFLCNEEIKFAEANFEKGDITWISPTLNQTHKLRNLDHNTDTCITIQCYMYNNDDNSHYDYFDYLDADNNIMQYEPDVDMDFINFKKTMINEWEKYKFNNNKGFFSCFK